MKIYRFKIIILIISIYLISVVCGLGINSSDFTDSTNSESLNKTIAIADFQTPDSKIKLAKHLTSEGAKMYGAYWCPYCEKQKKLFEDSFSQIIYIECDSKGQNSNLNLCKRKKIISFPTWEINGKLYPGMRTLKNLSILSNYENSLN